MVDRTPITTHVGGAFIQTVARQVGVSDEASYRLSAELSRPERHYHGAAHHALMLKQLERKRHLVLACLYHDSVYDPRAKDNEEQSAALAEHDLEAVCPELLPRIVELILATKGHEPTGDAETDAFLRADLWILSAPDRIYDWYARSVRKEYGFVPDDHYAAARSAVLGGLFEACARLFSADERLQMRRNLDRERTALMRTLAPSASAADPG